MTARRDRLDATGVGRVAGALDRTAAGAMADAVWASLAPRGVDRGDPGTWPSGFVAGHQGLRAAGAFDAFATPALAAPPRRRRRWLSNASGRGSVTTRATTGLVGSAADRPDRQEEHP